MEGPEPRVRPRSGALAAGLLAGASLAWVAGHAPAGPAAAALLLAAAPEDATDSFLDSTVGRLLVWIAAGSLVTGGLGLLAVEVGGLDYPLAASVGLGVALGGGLGAVGYLVATADEDQTAAVETVDVEMDDGATGSPSAGAGPRADDLFGALPDPTLYFAAEGESDPLVRAVNPAFEETFGVSQVTLSETPLRESLMLSDPDEDLRAAVLAGEAVDRRVRCETVDGERTFRLRAVPLDGDRTEGFVVYTAE